MGLNVIKWAYNLGVKHERQRIAAAMRHEAVCLDRREQAHFDYARERNGDVEERMKIDLAVLHKLKRFIDHMFEENGQYVPGESVMFPNKEEK